MKRLAGLVAMALLAGALAAAVPAGGAVVKATPTSPITLTFNARMSSSPWRAIAGEYAGTLRLRINPDGVITGWYRPSTGGGFNMVNGALEDDGKIWLSIGFGSEIQISGVYVNGRIDGTSSGPGMSLLTFIATQAK